MANINTETKVKVMQERAPLFEELQRYARQPLIPFHMPGHKAGRGLETEWAGLGFPANLDLTEIPAFNWACAWEEAERLAAAFFGSDWTFFLVQGATQGLIGSILGAFEPGDTVLVGRNCHNAVISGIILAGLNPVYIEAEFLPEFNIPIGINFDSLQRRAKEYPNFKGLIITNPSYQGVADGLKPFRKVAGDRILLVDEAHGGHLGWMGLAGYNAGDEADIWIHGTHKMLGSLTQTGMLHLKKPRIDPGRVKNSLALITTTSPSYILLAALDSTRRRLALEGARSFGAKLPLIMEFKDRIARLDGLELLSAESFSGQAKIVDPWKLCLNFRRLGLTGFEAEAVLRERFRIQPEYADLFQVTFLVAPWQAERELRRLKRALEEISGLYRNCRNNLKPFPGITGNLPQSIPQLLMTPRTAGLNPGRFVPLKQAVGLISAGVIAPYPPGIPLIAPGELIRSEEAEYIEMVLANKGMVSGVNRDGTVRVTIE